MFIKPQEVLLSPFFKNKHFNFLHENTLLIFVNSNIWPFNMQNLHCRYDFKTCKSLTSVKSTLAKATRTSDDPHSDDPDPEIWIIQQLDSNCFTKWTQCNFWLIALHKIISWCAEQTLFDKPLRLITIQNVFHLIWTISYDSYHTMVLQDFTPYGP